MPSAVEKMKSLDKQKTDAVLTGIYQYGNEIPTLARCKGQARLTLSRRPISRRVMTKIQLLNSDLVSSPHCELFYENGKQWVRDLQSKLGTFLNGVKLFPGLKSEIHPSDTISLGWSPLKVAPLLLNKDLDLGRCGRCDDLHPKRSGYLTYYCKMKYYVFKLKLHEEMYKGRKLPWNGDQQQQAISVESQSDNSIDTGDEILLPEEMVSEICKYLTVDEVKGCRLVSKGWNAGSIPILTGKTKISLTCHFDPAHKDSLQKNWQFVEEMKNLHHPDVRIYFYAGENRLTRSYNDNLWIFTQYLKFHKLALDCDVRKSWGIDFLDELLTNSSSTLRELHLYVRKAGSIPSHVIFFLQDAVSPLKFPLMRKLWLHVDHGPVPDVFNKVMSAFPNLQELVINGKRFLPLG